MFVLHLDCDLTAIVLRQSFPADRRRCASRLVFGHIQAGELQAQLIGRELVPLPDVTIEPRQRQFSFVNGGAYQSKEKPFVRRSSWLIFLI